MRYAAPLLALVLAVVVGCSTSEGEHRGATPSAATSSSDEGLAFPRSTAGPSAPRFLSGDTAENDAGPQDWVMVALKQNNDEDKYVVYGYVHKGQDAGHWTELFTYMNTPKPDEPPLAFMARQNTKMQKKCPTVRFSVLEHTDSEVIYESNVVKCVQVEDEDEIVRVIYGQVNLFRLSYTEHTAQMAASQRAYAIKLLKEFQLRENH